MVDETPEKELNPKDQIRFPEKTLEEAQQWLANHPESHKPYRKISQGIEEIWVNENNERVLRDVAREKAQIAKYLGNLEKQDPAHYKLITDLEKILPPMREQTRVAVNIPAYLEEKNLYRLLKEYTKQADYQGLPLDFNLYEINVIVNRGNQETPDQSVAEIQRFVNDAKLKGKNFQVNYIDVAFEPPYNNVGNARKVITDLTLLRSLHRQNQTGCLYIETEDADLVNVDPKIIINLITKLDNYPHLDAVLGIQDRCPQVMMQNDLLFFYRRIADYRRILLSRKNYRPENNPKANFMWNRIMTGGWNTGFTAEAYALIDGYDSLMPVGEDICLGLRMSMARGNKLNPNTEVIGRVPSRVDSSPRRYLRYIATGDTDYCASFSDTFTNSLIRRETTDQLLARISHLSHISDNNLKSFENVLNQNYEWIKDSTPNAQEAQKVLAMILLFIGFKKDDCEIFSDSIRIKNIKNLQKSFEDYRRKHTDSPNR